MPKYLVDLGSHVVDTPNPKQAVVKAMKGCFGVYILQDTSFQYAEVGPADVVVIKETVEIAP